MKRFSEPEIWNKIKGGSQEAFEFLFLSYYQDLCAYASGILHNATAAEEIVQETFVKLWEDRHNLTVEMFLKAYLYKAVRNSCLNYLEHQKVRNKHTQYSLSQHAFNPVPPISQDYPIANLLVKELEQKIEEAIALLPLQCREVFLLIRFEELSYAEVAEQLNISPNTVKTQLQRALNKLRDYLREYLPTHIFLVSCMTAIGHVL